jgi:hypothetical protein
MPWYTCRVNNVGPAADATETPNGGVYVNLTDTANPPAFAGQWFYFADNSKNSMMAVALAAISIGTTVQAGGNPPNAGNNPFTEIWRFYLNAPG